MLSAPDFISNMPSCWQVVVQPNEPNATLNVKRSWLLWLRPQTIIYGKHPETEAGWWFHPLWKILIGMIIPNMWKNKKCSKPPTRKWMLWYDMNPQITKIHQANQSFYDPPSNCQSWHSRQPVQAPRGIPAAGPGAKTWSFTAVACTYIMTYNHNNIQQQ